jgi:chromosome segregation ATPase
MVEKQGKHVGARIPDPSVWEYFLSHVQEKHGKIYGVTGLELQNALKFYLKNPEGTDIHTLQSKIDDLERDHANTVDKLNQKMEEIDKLNNDAKKMQNIKIELINEIKSIKEENKRFKKYRSKLDDKTGKYDKLLNQYDKLRNKLDHLQERFNKSQDEVNSLQRETSQLKIVMTKVQGMSLFDRLFNRLPEEIKEIETSQNNDN